MFPKAKLFFGVGGWNKKLNRKVPVGQSLRVLFYLPNKKYMYKQTAKNYLLEAGWHTNLLWFQGAQPASPGS